jgi:CxxC motif-containing protein
MGCHLHIERISDTEITVTGNRCPRGEVYAKEEILSPRRVVTATCAADIPPDAAALNYSENLYRPRRVPVRTTAAFPKERIPELLTQIYALKVKLPVKTGQVVLSNALGTGIDIIATRTM